MADHIDLREIMRAAGGYAPEVYRFIRDGLSHTVEVVHGAEDEDAPELSRHVTGRQLCLGLRDYAIERYGLLARAVLSRWGVTKTEDFGHIVFALVDAGLMRKTDEDTLEDFSNVYQFDEVFGRPLADSAGIDSAG